MKCEHCGGVQWAYDPEVNEEGWRCVNCGDEPGEPPGFSPQLDREELDCKIECLLFALHGDFGGPQVLYVSNSDHGANIVHNVANRCRELGMYDQYTICQLCFEMCGSHGEYWKRISEGVMSGNDTRHRCECGKLAVGCTMNAKGTRHYCAAHSALWVNNL